MPSQSSLHKEVHINVGQEPDIDQCASEQHIPCQAWGGIVICCTKPMMLHCHHSEVFKDVGEEEPISPQVQVMVGTEVLAAKGLPDILCMGIVLIRNILSRENIL